MNKSNDYNRINFFKCYKCGYSYTGENKYTICPMCKTDNSISKIGLIAFLIFIFTAASWFVSMFNSDLSFLFVAGLILLFLLIPFAFIDSLKRSKTGVDGFKTPETPKDIAENNVRVPDFIFLDYIAGLNFDYNIKKLIFDVAPKSLIIYNQKFEIITEVEYQKINDISFYSDVEYKHSFGKSIITATFGAMAFGGIGALIGGALGGINTKNLYAIEIKIAQDDGSFGFIQVSGKKNVLEKLNTRIILKKS